MFIKVLLITIYTMPCLMGFSQHKEAMLKGYVFDEATEHAILTPVIIEDTVTQFRLQTYANSQGYFQITKIPPGTYDVVVKSAGYDEYREKITLTASQIQTKQILLKEDSNDLEGLIDPGMDSTSVRPATINDIKGIPMAGDTKDIIRYLPPRIP